MRLCLVLVDTFSGPFSDLGEDLQQEAIMSLLEITAEDILLPVSSHDRADDGPVRR